MQRVQNIDIPAEKYIDFRTAPRGLRADVFNSGNDADGLLERPRYLDQLLIDRCDAVLHENDDAGKIRLRQNRYGKPEAENHARHTQAHDHEHKRAAVRLNKSRQRSTHFLPSDFSALLSSLSVPASAGLAALFGLTWALSGRP